MRTVCMAYSYIKDLEIPLDKILEKVISSQEQQEPLKLSINGNVQIYKPELNNMEIYYQGELEIVSKILTTDSINVSVLDLNLSIFFEDKEFVSKFIRKQSDPYSTLFGYEPQLYIKVGNDQHLIRIKITSGILSFSPFNTYLQTISLLQFARVDEDKFYNLFLCHKQENNETKNTTILKPLKGHKFATRNAYISSILDLMKKLYSARQGHNFLKFAKDAKNLALLFKDVITSPESFIQKIKHPQGQQKALKILIEDSTYVSFKNSYTQNLRDGKITLKGCAHDALEKLCQLWLENKSEK